MVIARYGTGIARQTPRGSQKSGEGEMLFVLRAPGIGLMGRHIFLYDIVSFSNVKKLTEDGSKAARRATLAGT